MIVLLAAFLAGALLAQPPQQAPATGPSSPQWVKLGIADKLRYDARHFIEVDNIVYAGIGASLDQWRERPGQDHRAERIFKAAAGSVNPAAA